MENKKISKKSVFIIAVIFAVALICVFLGYRYLFPTDKELFVMAHANLYSEYKDKEEPEVFTKESNISFDFTGDFTSKNAVKAAKTLSIMTEETKLEEKSRFIFKSDFLGEEIISSESLKVGDTTVLTIPMLSEKSYGGENSAEILSMLFGAETKAEDIDIFDNVDKEKLKHYLKKYSKKIYNSIPENDFISEGRNGVKIITLKTDADRVLYESSNEIKNDLELRDFLYQQLKIIVSNFNMKYPYAQSLVSVPSKDEFDKSYNESIEDFIKGIKNAEVNIVTEIGKGREILKETFIYSVDGKKQSELIYDENYSSYVGYEDGKEQISINVERDDESHTVTTISYDINDFTKEKSQGQKIITATINSVFNTNVEDDISLPQDYVDIRTIDEGRRIEIIEEVNENITGFFTFITLELLSVFSWEDKNER